MDIEGSEGMAFAGMSNLVRRNKDLVLITEFFPKYLDNHAVNANKYGNYFQLNDKDLFKKYFRSQPLPSGRGFDLYTRGLIPKTTNLKILFFKNLIK